MADHAADCDCRDCLQGELKQQRAIDAEDHCVMEQGSREQRDWWKFRLAERAHRRLDG